MVLYHYTSAAGLKGIVESASIWASEYRFLNDSTEFTYGLTEFKKLYRRSAKQIEGADKVLGALIEAYVEAIDIGYSVFIASFSLEGDLLSQWRGYNGGKGFSVGFDGGWINACAEANGFRLAPVCYEPSEHSQVLRDKISLLEKLAEEREREFVAAQELARKWWNLTLATIAVIKNRHFREEREYRLIKVVPTWPADTKTRVADVGLVPYVECPLDKAGGGLSNFCKLGINEVLVGPALHNRQIAATQALAGSNGLEPNVRKSQIPFVAT